MGEGARFWSQVVDGSSGVAREVPAPELCDLIMHVNWCALSGDGTLDPVT
jgi:hypothetical protein